MLARKQQWAVALTTIEDLYKGKLNFPLSQSAYVLFGHLIFNPKKPIPDDVKLMVVKTFEMIYEVNKAR
jgi:hypothetical protein